MSFERFVAVFRFAKWHWGEKTHTQQNSEQAEYMRQWAILRAESGSYIITHDRPIILFGSISGMRAKQNKTKQKVVLQKLEVQNERTGRSEWDTMPKQTHEHVLAAFSNWRDVIDTCMLRVVTNYWRTYMGGKNRWMNTEQTSNCMCYCVYQRHRSSPARPYYD